VRDDDRPLVHAAVRRALADRYDAGTEDVQRLIDATYRVVERTGSVDPTVREIIAEAGSSTQAFYRHFRSKDELLVAVLDDGRRQLVEYLTHQMAKGSTPEERVRAWIRGFLAQAADPVSRSRTRPFVAQRDRLAERFPEGEQVSLALLVGLLEPELRALGAGRDARRDARAILRLSMATMSDHVREGTVPTRADVEHLMRFCLAGMGGSASAR
jgi:AcrR family transcriptional regulator